MGEKWIGSPLTEIDESISIIEFSIRRKMKAIKQTEAKLELSENDKVKIGAEYDFIRHIRKLITAVKSTINANLGNMPPAAVDLEEVILGAIMLERVETPTPSKPTEYSKVIFDFLKPEHFYNDQHRLIYQAILDLRTAKDPVDMRSVVIQLRKNGNIDQVGGAHYIAELTSKVSSAANIDYHARMMVEFAIKRRLIMMSSEVLLEAYNDQSDCFVLMDKVEKQLNELDKWRRK